MRQFVRFGSAIAISILLSGGLTACSMDFFGSKPATESEILSGQQGRTGVAATAGKDNSNNAEYISPELLQDVAESKQETVNIRQDISNMKEVIFELTDEIDRLKRELEQLKSRR